MRRIGDIENTQATANVNYDQVIYNALAEDGVLPVSAIRYVIDQARNETNNYTSNVFLQDNNIAGYKYVSGAEYQDGPGLLSPEGDNYAYYDSIENSAHEVSAWWARRAADGFDLSTLTSIKNYADALKQFGWYTSSATAYAARMAAVDALVQLQQATGVNTQGVGLETISVAAIGLGVVLYMVFR